MLANAWAAVSLLLMRPTVPTRDRPRRRQPPSWGMRVRRRCRATCHRSSSADSSRPDGRLRHGLSRSLHARGDRHPHGAGLCARHRRGPHHVPRRHPDPGSRGRPMRWRGSNPEGKPSRGLLTGYDVSSSRYPGSMARHVGQSWLQLCHASTRLGMALAPSTSASRHDSPSSSKSPVPLASRMNRVRS